MLPHTYLSANEKLEILLKVQITNIAHTNSEKKRVY